MLISSEKNFTSVVSALIGAYAFLYALCFSFINGPKVFTEKENNNGSTLVRKKGWKVWKFIIPHMILYSMSYDTLVNSQNDETIKMCPFVLESKLNVIQTFFVYKWTSQLPVCS